MWLTKRTGRDNDYKKGDDKKNRGFLNEIDRFNI